MRDVSGSVSFQALPTGDVKKTEKKLDEEYAEACKNYKAAAKESLAGPRPQKPVVKVIEKNIRGKDAKEKAEGLAGKLQSKYDEKNAKKEEAPPSEGAKKKEDASAKKAKPDVNEG